MSSDRHALPPDLPVPRDDGAARGLPGRELPPLSLEATAGGPVDLRDSARDLLVLYVYPRTGGPGIPDIEGWDEIPGARGCTPENCAFRDHARELSELGATVHGLSTQPLEEQREFAARERMPYPLLNDSALALAADPGLPTFEAGGLLLYRRLTLIARAGRIEYVFYPVFPPDEHASEVLSWLRAAA
jgi:peroxiredoxin